MRMKFIVIQSMVALLMAGQLPAASTSRLKELVSIEGVRENQLIGYGLVVGLNGTGDRKQTIFAAQSLANVLQQMGVSVPPASMRVSNTAGVMVTATLPPFAQPGSRIDVTASAIGDATNLQGGTLLLTTLKSVDGEAYVVAQGAVVTGGFVAGKGGNSQTVNHPTVGRVPNGATVEKAAPSVSPTKLVKLQLRQADFTTAARIAEVVNGKFVAEGGTLIAEAKSSGLVQVNIPPKYTSKSIEFVSELERLQVEADRVAKVIVNERTGTIIIGKEVRVSPVAIMHGNLSIEIQTSMDVSQPAPMSKGTTEVVPQVSMEVKNQAARNLLLKEGASVEELVRALMSIGSSPRDVIAILQALRSAGALEAELEVV